MTLLTLMVWLVPMVAAAPGVESFHLRSGDEVQLSLKLGDRTLLMLQTLTIAPDGFLYLPVGGRVKATERPFAELRGEVAEEARRALKLRRPPAVELAVLRLLTRIGDSVNVVGAVQRPGPIVREAGLTLRAALGQAGGYLPRTVVREVQLVRGDQVTTMSATEALAGPPSSTVLQAGDLVIALDTQRPVIVFGTVLKPGPVAWFEGMRVSDAVAMAGGIEGLEFPAGDPRAELPQADAANVRVQRGASEYTVNLTALFSGDAAAANVMLVQPGDLVYVPPLRDRATVTGAVLRAGSFALRRGDRFLDVVGRAGLNPELADRESEALVHHANGAIDRIPLRPLLMEGEAKHNIVLQPGDLLSIPFTSTVAVTGEVKQPGVFPLREPATVAAYVFQAGGMTEFADFANITILRDGRALPERVNLDVRQPQSLNATVRVKAGDVILVPPREGIVVMGAVNAPGIVPHRPPMTLLDALGFARGLSPQADERKVSVIRQQGGRLVTLSPNVEALLKRNDRSQNVPLVAGDTVLVPFRRQGNDLISRISPFTFLFGFLSPFLFRR